MKEKSRVKNLIENSLKESEDLLNEAEGVNSSVNKSDEAFDLLDEARKSLQDAQANIYMKMPSVYQQLYKDQLGTIYNNVHNAIAEVQKLAKQMRIELGQ